VAHWEPKVNPFGLFGGQRPKAEAQKRMSRRLSMRAMKAVDLDGLAPDDVLEVDEFSVGDALEKPEQREEHDKPLKDPHQQAQRGAEQARKDPRAQNLKGREPKGMPSLRPEAYGPPQGAEVAKAPARPHTGPVGTDQSFSALVALDNAKDSGVFFKEDRERDGHTEDQEDPALREAVEECIRLLFGVRGIHHVGPGRNDANEPVIVVAASDGFTLVALPFDLVPLRRTTR
jgi:hypothetical protein